MPPVTSRLVQQLSLAGPQLVIPAPPGAQLGFDAPVVEPAHAPAEQVPVAHDQGLPHTPSAEQITTWASFAHRVAPGTQTPALPDELPPDDPLLDEPLLDDPLPDELPPDDPLPEPPPGDPLLDEPAPDESPPYDPLLDEPLLLPPPDEPLLLPLLDEPWLVDPLLDPLLDALPPPRPNEPEPLDDPALDDEPELALLTPPLPDEPELFDGLPLDDEPPFDTPPPDDEPVSTAPIEASLLVPPWALVLDAGRVSDTSRPVMAPHPRTSAKSAMGRFWRDFTMLSPLPPS